MKALRKTRMRTRSFSDTQATESSLPVRACQMHRDSVPPARFHQMTLTSDSDAADKAVQENVLLSPSAKKLYACLDSDPKGADELSQKTGLPVAQVMSAAVELLMEGCIHEVGKNQFVRG